MDLPMPQDVIDRVHTLVITHDDDDASDTDYNPDSDDENSDDDNDDDNDDDDDANNDNLSTYDQQNEDNDENQINEINKNENANAAEGVLEEHNEPAGEQDLEQEEADVDGPAAVSDDESDDDTTMVENENGRS
jgi:hypothetical protein